MKSWKVIRRKYNKKQRWIRKEKHERFMKSPFGKAFLEAYTNMLHDGHFFMKIPIGKDTDNVI
jgi:hypothetical protein